MRYLIDAHTLLWWMSDDPQLSRNARAIMQDDENVLLLSAASTWEIATKFRLGRLPAAAKLVREFPANLMKHNILTLAVSAEHGIQAGLLPGPRKDPFDRMLIAQAIAEDLPIVSNDVALDGYGASRVW